MNLNAITVDTLLTADTVAQTTHVIIVQSVLASIAKQKNKKTLIADIIKMFRRHQITLMSNPCCSKKVLDLSVEDFRYYDKDGFELTKAEQKFYKAMGYPIEHSILNHCCWQEPWFELEHQDTALILDHSMFLCRCNYERDAEEQLKELKASFPLADFLLKTKRKWGFDFALDAVSEDGTAYEVLHVEYDNCDYDTFKNYMINFEWTVRHTDWEDAAKQIWNQKYQWETLKGFAQNDWKAKYLLGWNKSEYTEKTV